MIIKIWQVSTASMITFGGKPALYDFVQEVCDTSLPHMNSITINELVRKLPKNDFYRVK